VSASTSPPRDEPTGSPKGGLWVFVLVLGFIVAVLGVNAAIGSVQRKQYFETRVAAIYLLRNGNAINTSMQRLQDVNVRDYTLLEDAHAAFETGNTPLANRLVGQADVFSGEQAVLQREVQRYKAGFDKASNH
jgi:hypothetical protein